MNHSNAFSHLTLEERRIILTGISNGSTKSAIAKTIGKDRSTVAKEIRLHRTLSHKCKMPLECNHYRKCVHGRQCTPDCPEYSPFRCSRRDRSPGACNGCSNWSRCRFNKFRYSPEDAHLDYRSTLVDARRGVNLTVQEAISMASLIAPLLRQGLSPYQILAIHPELNISEKTLYNYIESGVFREIAGITSLDLRRQVSRKLPRSIRKERTGAICEAGPIRTIWPISHNTRMSSSFRWIRSITMDRTALSFRPLNSSRPAFSLPSIMKKRPLPP